MFVSMPSPTKLGVDMYEYLNLSNDFQIPPFIKFIYVARVIFNYLNAIFILLHHTTYLNLHN